MIQLRIEYSTTVINLQADGYTVLDGYYPQVATDLSQNVTESVDVWIVGSTSAAREALTRALEMAFDYARRHPTGLEACYLYFGIDSAATPWRARIYDGAVMLDSKLTNRWRAGRVKCALSIVREPGWDGPEAAVTISNPNVSGGTTSGLKIYSCADGSGSAPNKRVNYAAIAAAQIGGSLPAKCRLEITNNYATSRLYDMWIGHGWDLDFTNLPHLLEAEAATGGADESNSAYSGGKDRLINLSYGAEADLLNWALTAAEASALNGHRFKVMGRWVSNTAVQVRWRIKQKWQDSEWPTGQKYFDTIRNTAIRDLFTLRMPPWALSGTPNGGYNLILTGQQTAQTNPLAIRIDFLALLPADGYRYLSCSGYGLAQNQRIVDDGVGGEVYADDGAGNGRVGIMIPAGQPLMLQPGKDQRLYFYMGAVDLGTSEITRTISLKVFYRPRRLAL